MQGGFRTARTIEGRVIEHDGQVACDDCEWQLDIASPNLIDEVKAHVSREAHAVTIQLTMRLFDREKWNALIAASHANEPESPS